MSTSLNLEFDTPFDFLEEITENERCIITDPEIINAFFHNTFYSPTPLNPHSLMIDGNRVGYSQYAQTALAERFDLNLSSLDKSPPSEAVTDLLQTAINNALFRRLENNDSKHISEDCDDRSAELFVKACQGTADQDELLELLKLQPRLGSVELAKETNPFIWNETTQMDNSVTAAVAGLRKVNGFPRYYFSTTDQQCEALIVVRKKDIAEEGKLVVVQRDCFAIDLAQPMTEIMRIQLIKDADNLMKPSRNVLIDPDSSLGDLISSLIEPEMHLIDDHSPVVYPGARSYYANYRSV
ncbi:hypothetical protein H7X69_03065 [Candidatus Saccharibacteria bacterium]|nr:hypothetical protein [Candidatus Saccharibacteria bacterium]